MGNAPEMVSTSSILLGQSPPHSGIQSKSKQIRWACPTLSSQRAPKSPMIGMILEENYKKTEQFQPNFPPPPPANLQHGLLM